MSHFCTFVLVEDSGNNRRSVEAKIANLLYKYNENLEMAEHDEECWCVGSTARDAAFNACQEKFGSLDTIREKYWNTINSMISVPIDSVEAHFNAREEATKQYKWETYMAEWNTFEKQIEAEHPLYKKPSPDCEECNGTGTYKSTSNQHAKWDWYQIGGRWSGMLDSYDPATDPNNIEMCWICQGTGMRNDQLGLDARAKDPNYTCNGCNGEGKSVKWPTQFSHHKGDIQPVETVLQLIEKSTDNCPFALITPDGEWHERGEMGWWATVSDEKDEDVWTKTVIELLKANRNMSVVVVDCHI